MLHAMFWLGSFAIWHQVALLAVPQLLNLQAFCWLAGLGFGSKMSAPQHACEVLSRCIGIVKCLLNADRRIICRYDNDAPCHRIVSPVLFFRWQALPYWSHSQAALWLWIHVYLLCFWTKLFPSSPRCFSSENVHYILSSIAATWN